MTRQEDLTSGIRNSQEISDNQGKSERISLQKILNMAMSYLHKKEFNEALAFLGDCPDDIPEIEHMLQEFVKAKKKEINTLLKEAENAQHRKDLPTACQFLRRALTLDDRDDKVRAAQECLRNALVNAEHEEQLSGKKKRAGDLLKNPSSISDIDTAIRLLEETVAASPGEIEAESLLKDAQRKRGDFLKEIGLVSTLEQAEEYEEALTKLNDLINWGRREYIDDKGNRCDIFEYRSQLERKVENFSDQKAAKYLKKAEDALDQGRNPRLSLKYIETGLGLPGIPKNRRDAFCELKMRVELDLEELREVEIIIKEACNLMDQQKYEPAISRLKSALARFPWHIEAQTFLKLAHESLKFREVDQQVKEACDLMDQQRYEKAIFKLEESLGKIPRHMEAQTFFKLAREGLRDKILKDSRIFMARIESGLNKNNFQKIQADLVTLMDPLYVLGDFQIEPINPLKQIFISYSHRDKEFVNRLYIDLENAGMRVWLDQKEIKVGDVISKKIEQGISGCDFFCMVISNHSVNSNWVDREYRAALNVQLSSDAPKILPILTEEVELPLFLKDIKFADFSRGYNSGLLELLKAIK